MHAPCPVAPSPSPRLFRVESRSLFLHYTCLSYVLSSDLPVPSHAARCSTQGRFRLALDPPSQQRRVAFAGCIASFPAYGCGPVSLLSQLPSHAPSLPPPVHLPLPLPSIIRTPSTPWRAAARAPTSSACTTASARRLARAASASSSRAPTCSTSSRSPSNSSRARAMLPNCAMSTARTRSSWAAVSTDLAPPLPLVLLLRDQHHPVYQRMYAPRLRG